jgi:hypothetical protein
MVAQSTSVSCDTDRRRDVGVGELETVANQRRQLADDAIDLVDVGRFAIDDQVVALGADLDVEERLEALEVLVVKPNSVSIPLGTVMRFIWLNSESSNDSRNCFKSPSTARWPSNRRRWRLQGKAITSRIDVCRPGSRRYGRAC